VAAVDAAPRTDWHEGPVPHTRDLTQVIDAMIAGQSASTAADIRALPGVTAAVRLLAGHIAGLPVVPTSGTLPRWLSQPRAYGGGFDWPDMLQHIVDSMVIHGRGYLAATCVAEGDRPSFRVDLVDPQYVQTRQRADGIVGLQFSLGGTPAPMVPWALSDCVKGRTYLVHIPYRVSVDHPEGTTPLVDAAAVLRGHWLTEQHAARMLDLGTHTGGVLSTDHDLTETQAKAWQTAAMDAQRAGKVMVLGNGLTYRNEVPNAVDLQMVESRSFNQSVVWSLLGIPQSIMGSSMMGGQSSLSYSNAQDNERLYSRNALRPIGQQIDHAISQLLPHGRNDAEDQRVTFDYSAWEVAGSEPDDPAVDTATA
jgi:phage portal protein BeeE